jgi:hypothetical protein
MTNVFRRVTSGLHDSPLIIAIFLTAFVGFLIGLNLMVEDVTSSYLGYQQLVAHYGVVPAIYAVTWIALSLAPSVGILLFGYMYMQDTTQTKYRTIAIGLFILDFSSDLWHRSNDGRLIFAAIDSLNYAMFGTGNYVALSDGLGGLFVSSMFTFLAFTIGAEIFVIVGVGVMGESYVPFFRQIGLLRAGVQRGLAEAKNAANGVTPRNNPPRP